MDGQFVDAGVYVMMKCKRCGKYFEVEMTEDQLAEWTSSNSERRSVQEIFPDKDATTRETLLSKMCPDCVDEIFGACEEPEEEEES
jgi:uncharacterized CHY-type Zn-finger protein